jgi:hypothetical protein
MKKKFKTKFGNAVVSFAMIDTDGTNLEEGVDFNVDDKFVGDAIGLSLDNVNENNIEELLEIYCSL